jgi:hypothetical protein
MNKTINALAKKMDTLSFINELDARNVDFTFDQVDNVMDFNEGTVNLIVGGASYLFADGELLDVSY